MELWKALLIGLLGWASSLYGLGLFGIFGGWQCVGKPLIAGTIIGIILGDVTTGILMGAAIQTLYIGLVTPGMSMPGDVNLAGWIGIPLAIVAGASSEYALALAVPLSFLGSSLTYLVASVNCIWVHKQEKLLNEGKIKQAARIPIWGASTNFLCRFVPIFLSCYFGSGVITWAVENMPLWLGSTFILLGKMLPAIGFALLLSFMVRKKLDLLYFFIGFVFLRIIGVGIVPCTIIALFLAYIDYLYNNNNRKPALATAAADDEEDE